MTVPCPYFNHLNNRLTELTDKFLRDQLTNETQDPLSFQPDLDRLAAYRLLIHAEIEEFLELKAKENITKIESCIRAGQPWMKHHPELLSLAVELQRELPIKKPEHVTSKLVSDYITGMLASAKKEIKENNGIKSQSFSFLSICAGKTADEIDNVLSNSLNSYGKSRGDVAHTSAARSNNINAPSAEHKSANDLINGLKLFFGV
ncbi:hypothetical protein [Aeromonas sp. 600584]|uniref:hypothetical protein n=1 Tax=Aeromonas sp. 600584 TaxID=2712030 RepID=UPI003BA04F11